MKRIRGRLGKWNEFIEYKPIKGIAFIAQKTGDEGWYVYRNERGAIKTLKHFRSFNAASAYAFDKAQAEQDRAKGTL